MALAVGSRLNDFHITDEPGGIAERGQCVVLLKTVHFVLNTDHLMHELSIAMSILDIAQEESDRRGGAQVKAIHIRLGQLSGVVTEALLSAYDLAREMSPFPDAQLVIEEVPIEVYCDVCEQQRAVESVQKMACVECGTPTANIVRGQDMEITAMEIEEPETTDRNAVLESES